MIILRYIFLIFPVLLVAQTVDTLKDATSEGYVFFEGDSIPTIELNEVVILNKLNFGNREDRLRYLILRRKTLKVYPYAKLAADRLDSLNNRLAMMKRRSDRNRYTRMIQKYIEGEFSDELKKMTRTEGQILVKLIHRQTGETTFGLVKELRSGWRAFWYNTTASMFNISLKREFDPMNVQEDYLIEDILERSFRSGLLPRQDSALDFNFADLTEKWATKAK
ncbi:DUF4294 domain-containing protein [Confluentibacter flavum]|uniref:DUF4294 domain-containing protein n=1 Tax=Confluentibacter flavum TaxID=1909700 RepID=A0A2N3HNH0_9FLAO|nr:DUF4294 domain-containing protein [Confluentibacter flavum]PKQ46523.1 DUF4294 domain-containing protein [Confluentibacter flavum]